MHEVSIVQGLFDIVTEKCRSEGYKGVKSIKVKIGKASGIMTDAFIFAFESMKNETIADKAELIIEEIAVSGYCHGCNSDFTVDEAFVISCPKCGEVSFQLKTGRELNIDEMEVF